MGCVQRGECASNDLPDIAILAGTIIKKGVFLPLWKVKPQVMIYNFGNCIYVKNISILVPALANYTIMPQAFGNALMQQ